MNLRTFQQEMAKLALERAKQEAISSGFCIQCQQAALPKCYSEMTRREFYIDGLCEECFDELCEESFNEFLKEEKNA